jgi:hypothetical protein
MLKEKNVPLKKILKFFAFDVEKGKEQSEERWDSQFPQILN